MIAMIQWLSDLYMKKVKVKNKAYEDPSRNGPFYIIQFVKRKKIQIENAQLFFKKKNGHFLK